MQLSLRQVLNHRYVCRHAEKETEYEKKNKMVFWSYIRPFLVFLELRPNVVVTKKYLFFLTE